MAQQRALAGLLVLLAALCALASAQVPTIKQSTASFDQNGGVLTVYGTGFTQRNLNQFTYTLVTGKTAAGANSPCVNGCPFFCHYRSMVVNPAGTITFCEVPYIPDGTLGITGSNYITLSVNNANGMTPTPVTVAVINAVPTQITPSTSNPVPPFTTGLTLTGVGFPSADSLFVQGGGLVSTYQLTLTDNIGATPAVINLLAYRTTSGLTGTPLAYWAGAAPNGLGAAVVRYSKTQIDIYYLNQISFGAVAGGWAIENNANGLFATLQIAQQFSTGSYVGGNPTFTDTVGPVQIGVITQNVAPTLTPVPIVAPFSPASFVSQADPTITVSGANFLQFPFVNANNLVFAAGNNLRCDPMSATATTFTCAKSFAWNLNTDIKAGGLAANQIQATLYSGNLPDAAGQVTIGLVNSAGVAGFKYPISPVSGLPDTTQMPLPTAIVPNDQTIQQDAHTLTFSSVAGSFPLWDIPYLYEYNPVSTAATAPANVAPQVQLSGLFANPATTVTCTATFPDQANPNMVALVTPPFPGPPGAANQAPPAMDACTIVAMTKDTITVNFGGIMTAPVGQVVQAAVLQSINKAAAVTTHALTPVGIIAPAAGVGGDPHFFGFLGEKYEFAGEPGRVYNLLTDDGLQVNAEIGLWHWKRGNETIIRKLAFRTESDHRVLIDAGGNTLASDGFSISVDGAPVIPSRTQKTFLGSDGWVRWYPLTAEDKFRLPLWERHQGVALIDMMVNDYKFQILAVEEGKDKNGEWHQQPSRFLDFMASMLNNERRPHGLFGQSAHLRANQRSVHEFAIEGSGSDYEVSNLFGEDFVFNKFSARK